MKYVIVSRPCRPELIEEVNDGIKVGWEPLGGVCVFPRSFENEGGKYDGLWAQAMVKREPDDD